MRQSFLFTFKKSRLEDDRPLKEVEVRREVGRFSSPPMLFRALRDDSIRLGFRFHSTVKSLLIRHSCKPCLSSRTHKNKIIERWVYGTTSPDRLQSPVADASVVFDSISCGSQSLNGEESFRSADDLNGRRTIQQ